MARAQTWRPYLPHLPAELDHVVSFAAWFDDTPRHHESFDVYARASAEQAHPAYLAAREAEQHAGQTRSAAWHELRNTQQHYNMSLQHYGTLAHGDDPADRLAREQIAIAFDTATLTAARDRNDALLLEPTLRVQPFDTIDLGRAEWTSDRQHRDSWLAASAAADREAPVVDPRSRGVGGILEISLSAPIAGSGRDRP